MVLDNMVGVYAEGGDGLQEDCLFLVKPRHLLHILAFTRDPRLLLDAKIRYS